MHASHRSIRLRWSYKSTRIQARLALSPGVSHKKYKKLTNKNKNTNQNHTNNNNKKQNINHEREPPQFDR